MSDVAQMQPVNNGITEVKKSEEEETPTKTKSGEEEPVTKTKSGEEEPAMKTESEKEEPATKTEEKDVDNSVNMDTSAIPDESLNKSDEGNVGDNEEEEESDSEEELPPGLLERPIEILEEKRVRKKITRFTYDDVQTSPSSEKKKSAVVIPEGTGIRLGDHPRVEYQLQRNKVEDLKIIHKFFFGTLGDQFNCRKRIREFRGFTFAKDSPEYEKKEEVIGKFTVDNLKWAMEVCDVPHSKGIKKDDLIDAFMEWALSPKPQDKPVPQKRKKKDQTKKKKATKRKIKTSKEDAHSTDAGTPVKKTKKKKESDAKKKKTKVKSSPKKNSSASPNKKAKIKLSSPKRKHVSDSEPSDSDDEPLQRKKGPPSNDEILKFVEDLLRGADLEVITMKSVFQQVYEQYPEFDLSDRKSFIKETVKKIIS